MYKDPRDGNPRQRQVYGSPQFHDACSAAFNANHTVKDCIAAAEAVFAGWVWDGQHPALQPHQIDPDLYAEQTGGAPIYQQLQSLTTKQARHYNDMQNGPGGFKNMEAKVSGI